MMMKNMINRLTVLSLLLLGGLGFVSCSDDDGDFIDLPIIEMPQSEEGPVFIDYKEILNTGKYVYDYTIQLDKPATTNLFCDITVDESMVEAYNTEHNTAYKMMPSFVYELQAKTAIIKKGEQESNSLSIEFASLYGLAEGEEYLLPVVAVVDETCTGQFTTDTRSVAYFTINIDGELDYIPGLDMRSYSKDMYQTLSFADGEVVTIEDNTHTFEMLIYPYSWHNGINYIGTWRGKDINENNASFSGCEFRVSGTTGASNIGNRQCDLTLANQNKKLPINQWVRLTVTCDGTKTGQNTEIAYRLYVNGEEIATAKPTKRWGTSSPQRFKVGYTLTGIQFGNTTSSYYFDGLISDIRMWKKCLTQEEVRANLRTIASPSPSDLYGYWKLDEGEGNTLKDSSGNGRDLTFPTSANIIWNAEFNDLPQDN
ncbi:DUF1735 domain-containing protein [Bacteroides zhangwenhongii]|jgi:hypothetical protein|uniref:BT_3987 domain-containing protein n=1 Tax=Bacteroides zhangwenhongii TaxID=2650157 RepID=UPI0032C1CE09